MPAVRTKQATRVPRVHQRDTTGGATGHLAAVTTNKSAGIALPIEKQQDASPATDHVPHGQNERPTQDRTVTLLA